MGFLEFIQGFSLIPPRSEKTRVHLGFKFRKLIMLCLRPILLSSHLSKDVRCVSWRTTRKANCELTSLDLPERERTTGSVGGGGKGVLKIVYNCLRICLKAKEHQHFSLGLRARGIPLC